MQIHPDKVLRDSSADSDRCLAISGRIPCNTNAWLEILPLAFHTGIAVESGITRIAETGWRAGNDFTLNTFVEIIEAECIDIRVSELHGHEWRPAKPIVQRQFTCGFPRVLNVSGEIVLRQVFGIRIGLVK